MKPSLLPIALAALVPAASAKVVAVYDLPSNLSESGREEMSLLATEFDPNRPLTFHDVATSLAKAAADDEVGAIVLDADDAPLGFGQILEIRRHLADAREAGKDVWIYSDHFSNRSALLGSAANHFVLMPEADCDFAGIYAESMYFKGLLDKAGVSAEVIHIGDFKSFGEEFYRTGPSEAALKQQTELIDGIFAEIVREVATGRGLEESAVRAMIDRGTFTATEAKDAGLVDELGYRTDFNKTLRDTYASDDFETDYELPDLDGPEISGLLDVFKLLMSSGNDDGANDDFVAVVVLDGSISEQSVAPVRKEIISLMKDPHAKALVLRVDSPGGSALASEVLWEATDEWKASGRPFVVSMADVAASGGYYVSAGADKIFAEPGTITGSIGVVGMKLVMDGALEKLGITTHGIERGEHADAMAMTKSFSPEEAELVRSSMEGVYETFKKRVVDGRGERLKGELEPMAGGRVYTGRRALELGLVDELGGLSDAIAWAAKKADVGSGASRLCPEPKSMLEGMFTKPRKNAGGELVAMSPAGGGAAGMVATAIREAGLGPLPIELRQPLQRGLDRLEAIGESRIQLIGPDLRVRW